MPTLNLAPYKPAPDTPGDATQVAGGFTALESWANGGLDLTALGQNGATVGQTIVWTGTMWAPGTIAAGSSPAAGTTVAALNTAFAGTPPSGAVGTIRAGASPFDFVTVTYDATYGKWVSAPWEMATLSGIQNNNPPSYVELSPGRGSSFIWPWKVFDTAGLKAQFRWFGGIAGAPPTTAYMKIMWAGQNIGAAETAPVDIPGAEKTTTADLTPLGIDTGWLDIAAGYTAADSIRVAFWGKILNNTYGITWNNNRALMRWVG